MIGSQEVDAADAISVDSPVVFFLQNHSNIYVSALHTLAIKKVASSELFNKFFLESVRVTGGHVHEQ